MPIDDYRIATRIAEAQTGQPLVTEAVLSTMTEVLKGPLSEQQLSQKDLTKLANALIADMVPRPPEANSNP